MKKYALLTVLSLTAGFLAAQEEPDWLSRRPRSDNYFYGRDFDPTADEAEESGRRELRLQLSSQVNVAARMESADQGKIDAEEKMDAYFDTVRLRTAEVEDAYQNEDEHYALMPYPEDCGLVMAKESVGL